MKALFCCWRRDRRNSCTSEEYMAPSSTNPDLESVPIDQVPETRSEISLAQEVEMIQELRNSERNDVQRTRRRRRTREGRFRNPDHYPLASPAVLVYTNLTPGLGRRIPIYDDKALMVHYIFDREVERRIHLAYLCENDIKKNTPVK